MTKYTLKDNSFCPTIPVGAEFKLEGKFLKYLNDKRDIFAISRFTSDERVKYFDIETIEESLCI